MKTTKTQNSRIYQEKVKMYEEDGWNVTPDGQCSRKTLGGVEHRTLLDDGKYDTWYPLPKKIDASDNNLIAQAIAYNKEIDNGSITATHNGHIPSAWLDLDGYYRNLEMYKKIKNNFYENINRKKFYQRDGKKFVRVRLLP